MSDSPDDGLSVRRSDPQADNINPDLRAEAPFQGDADALFEGVRTRDRVALARAITLVESRREEDRSRALDLLDRCQAFSGTAYRIGFSGAPGVGKSTLIDALGLLLVESGRRVAVLAVDPSSERTGGSILGDKTRMARLVARPEAYVRPSPSSGALGGVARATRPAISILEAAGFDTILIETVGVGQSETAVRHMTDTFVLLTLAGAGDELQGIKRGIVEAADIVAVAKADGSNVQAARAARDVLKRALRLLPSDESGWRASVQAVSAFEDESVQALLHAIDAHHRHAVDTGALAVRRRGQAVRWMHDELSERLLDRLRGDPTVVDALHEAEARVADGRDHPYRAADSVVGATVDSRR